ncbi:MAG: DUF3800 domain-containing protein [Nanoarchaeota archaeon]
MNNKKFECQIFKTGYLDESGDTGKDGSKCLVLTYICTDEGKKIAKILKRAKEALRRTKKGERWLNRHGGEIKFAGFPEEDIRQKTIEELAQLKFPIRFITIYKDGGEIPANEKETILYDLLVESLVKNECMPHKIIADKDYFKNKKVAYLAVKNYEEFVYPEKEKKFSYEVLLIEQDEKDKLNDSNLVISIKHENSKNVAELQAVDLISGAIFQEMENGDKTYTDLIKKYNKILGAIKKIRK